MIETRKVMLGTDIIEIARIAEMIDRHGTCFTRHVFTDSEIAYSTNKKRSAEHFAGRWAAKEAVLKVLGTGWTSGISWKDVEVAAEMSGKPNIILHGGALRRAEKLGITEIQISISHCKEYAVAVALGT